MPQAVSERLFLRLAYRQLQDRTADPGGMLDVAWPGTIPRGGQMLPKAHATPLTAQPPYPTGPRAVVIRTSSESCVPLHSCRILGSRR